MAVTKDGVRVTILWVILTLVGEIAIFTWSMLPEGFSEEARVVDEAFLILMAFAVPVFAFVVAMLGYSAVRFRVKHEVAPTRDGPPLRTDRRVVRWWLAATILLAGTVLIWPGFTGLAELRAEGPPDLVVEVQAQRWNWIITYPNGGLATTELVLPVDTRIRFDVTSVDILHSFWIPAFRTKIDAVPGRTTELFITADRIGSMEVDSGLRIQCAELCGLGHSRMAIPVTVLDQAGFEQWLNTLVEEGS